MKKFDIPQVAVTHMQTELPKGKMVVFF